MRLVAIKQEPFWLDEGTTVEGHTVERIAEGPGGAEVRCVVRSPAGTLRTLVTSQRGFADRRERARFRKLAECRAALDHPAAIPIRVVGEYANRPVLIGDVYPARTLRDLLRRQAPLAPERAIALFAPVAEALDIAHEAGLTHHALTSDALLLHGDDELTLDDFGLLRSGEEDWGVIDADDLGYRSPEQLWGDQPSAGSNVYSMTALMVHALTGAPPYTGDRTALMYRHVAEEPPKVSERLPGLARQVDAVVAQGLAKDPLERPSSAGELIDAFAGALRLNRPERTRVPAGRPHLVLVDDEPPRAPRAPVQRSPVRRPARAFAAVIAAAVACGVIAAVIAAPSGENRSSASQPRSTAPWSQLVNQRAELRDRLATARTPADQAEAALALSSLYEAAARTHYPRGLAAVAAEADRAYTSLAQAAGRNDDAGYAEAARAVAGAEARLAGAATRQ